MSESVGQSIKESAVEVKGAGFSGNHLIRCRAFCLGRFHTVRKGTEGISHADRFRIDSVDRAALVLYYDIIHIFMVEHGQLCGGGTASWRSPVCPFFMGSACQ